MDTLFSAGAGARILLKGVDAEIFEDIGIAYELHGIRKLFIFEHEECGMYAKLSQAGDERFSVSPATEQAVHGKNAKVTARLLQEHYPELGIELFFVTKSGACAPLL